MIQYLRMNRILFFFSIISLTACGTFEIGIENNVLLETQVEFTEQPTIEVVDIPTQEATQTPIPSDQQLIATAIAEQIGKPVDQLDITVTTITGRHATGFVDNGYFLAAKQDDSWVYVYAGQATPACSDVDLHQFPLDMVPECLDANLELVIRSGEIHQPASNLQSLDCGPGSSGANRGTVEYVACNIQDGLRSRNTSALLDYMADPFIIGYWLSEAVQYTPQDFLILLPQLYNFNDPDYTPRLPFTTDRSQFPELDGRPLEGRYGPDVNVVEVIYSQGWGAEGDNEALIYLSQDSAGDFKWHGMLTGDLDIPLP